MSRFVIVGDLGSFSTTNEINKWPNEKSQPLGEKVFKIYPILILSGFTDLAGIRSSLNLSSPGFPQGACHVNTS